jgi:tetratricopeptide (TPR) repeat protein
MIRQPAQDKPTSTGAPALTAVELAGYCLLKLKRPADAEKALKDGQAKNGQSDGGYYLGIALAQQGKLDAAVAALRRAQEQPATGQAARATLLVLLKKQAQRYMARQNWEAAGEALSQAVEIAPQDAALQGMLSALGNHLPVAYLKMNKRKEAAAAWEDALQKNPTNMKIAHSLGLLYYWWAQSLETQHLGNEATVAWEGAIRNLVAVAYDDAFWARWLQERTPVIGHVLPAAAEALRKGLTDQIARRISDCQNDYLTRKRDADAARMGQLSLKVAAELQTANALKHVQASLLRQGKKADFPPLCGVLMLTHLHKVETAQNLLALVQATQTNAASTEQLRWCLSPWVFPWIMVQEHRYEDAIVHIEKQLTVQASSKDGHDLLATASLERGKILAAAGEVVDALHVWKAGLGHVRNVAKTGEEIKTAAENAAVKEATRLQNTDGEAGLKKAISLLELAQTIVDSKRLRQNLAEFYTRLGIEVGNDEKRTPAQRIEQAERHLRHALEIDPDNARTKKNLSIVLTDVGISSCNNSFGSGSTGWQRGIGLLKEAYRLDSTNTRARENLTNAGESPDLDVEEIMRLLNSARR